jgi:hypothetical protein
MPSHGSFAFVAVNVLVRNEHLVPVGSGYTNQQGFYYVPNLIPGRYILEIYYFETLLQKYSIEIPFDPSLFRPSPRDPSKLIFDVGPVEVSQSVK